MCPLVRREPFNCKCRDLLPTPSLLLLKKKCVNQPQPKDWLPSRNMLFHESILYSTERESYYTHTVCFYYPPKKYKRAPNDVENHGVNAVTLKLLLRARTHAHFAICPPALMMALANACSRRRKKKKKQKENAKNAQKTTTDFS